MPVRYKVSEDGLLAVERWSGNIGHEEAIQHQITLNNDPKIAPGAVIFSDTRTGLFPSSNASNIVEMLETRRIPDREAALRRAAIWMASVETWDKARIFQKAAAKFGLEVELFAEFTEACEWLNVEEESVKVLLDQIPS